MTAPMFLARTRRLLGVALFGTLSLLPLAACTTSTPELEAPAATQLQSAVLLVTESSAAGDFATALQQLDAVEATLLDAAAGEKVSAARAARIQAAITMVRTDLEAAIRDDEATPAPAETSSPSESPSTDPSPSSEPTFDPDCNKGQEKKGTCSREDEPEDGDD
ncbi:MAG: hypothetical protein ABWY30_02670 [Microterricola sp.]